MENETVAVHSQMEEAVDDIVKIFYTSLFSVNSEIRYQKAISVGGRSDSSYLQNHATIYTWTTTH